MPWVLTSKRCSGHGCCFFASGSHRRTSCPIRTQWVRSRCPRRCSARCQCQMIWERKCDIARVLVGTAWYAKYPRTTPSSHA
ncbi:hypothetical protein STIAU_7299, partial [Stigmatella aurantiaca DW4/3-1]